MLGESEILKALRTIQDVCESNKISDYHYNCKECLLRNAENSCGLLFNSNGEIYNSLLEWELKDDDKPRLILN
jgi:hypothetical protein